MKPRAEPPPPPSPVPSEPAAEPPPPAATCTRCDRPPAIGYWTSEGATYCNPCAEHVRANGPYDGRGGFGRALAYGVIAALACSGVWYAILATTEYELGLLGIVVGLVVGGAVRKGSGRRGGRIYQALAAVLVYAAIVSSYVPLLLEAASESGGAPADGLEAVVRFLFACVIAPAVPFLAGPENLFGIGILAFGVWEGWKLNRRIVPAFEGPFPLPAAAGRSDARVAA